MRRVIISLIIIWLCVTTTAAQDLRDYLGEGFNDVSAWRQGAALRFETCDGYLADTSTTPGAGVIARSIDGYKPEGGDTHWQIALKCNYDNSSVNNFQIYLVANGDNPDAEDFRGVAVGTGFKPNYKALSLIYRHDGITETIANTDITISKNKVFTLDILRTSSGVWSIGGKEISTTDIPCVMLADHIVVTYTFNKNGAGKFAVKFDGFSQDCNALQFTSTVDDAFIIDPVTVRLNISGGLDLQPALDPAHYSVGGVMPNSVDYNFYSVYLHYPDTIENVGNISVVADGLIDGAGNPVAKFQKIIRQALPGEIIINEIMVDINPAPYSLPAKKFVELYNTTPYDFDMDGYILRIGDSDYEMPAVNISSGYYMILASDAAEFGIYGQAVSLFQESKLTVDGKHVAIVNKIGAVVDSLTYSQDFYNDKDRNSGGFSMERLDPYNNCTGVGNWHASKDLSGGTPGRLNSVYKIYEDNAAPEVVGCELLSNNSLRIDFSEDINSADFTVAGVAPAVTDVEGSSAFLTMTSPLSPGENTVKGSAVDVCGTESGVCLSSVVYTPLKVTSVYAVSSYQVLINFSTAVSVVENEFFTLDNGAMPSLAEYVSDGSNGLLLTFADDFEQDSRLNLTINGTENSIHDRISNEKVSFNYHRVGEGDIIINEVLYYPNVGMKRYVELFNNSGSDIFLFGLVLSGYTSGGDLLRSCNVDGYVMLPDGGYAVVTADTANVALNYNAQGLLVESSRFPSLNTSRGYVSLRSSDGVLLDSMYYDNSMQSNLLESRRGVALERVDALKPSLDEDNWVSASEQYGHATPGFANSCASDDDPDDDGEADVLSEAVSVENRLMRPGDADSEFTLTFNFDRPSDPLLSVSVYDSDGREVCCVASEVLAYRGCNVAWDGRDRHGARCRSGIYVVLIKAADDSGWSFVRKEACVIGNFR